MSRKNALIYISVGMGSAAVASGITWYISNKRLEQQYEDHLAEEIKISVQYILKQMGLEDKVVVSNDDPDILSEQMNDAEQPVEVVTGDIGELLEDIHHDMELVEEALDDIEGERVFASQENKPPLEDLAARNQQIPYHKVLTPDIPDEIPDEPAEPIVRRPENPDITVISRDIFLENGTEWEQTTVTYFADDGVLDIEGNFIDDHVELIGEGRPPFGELSEDANVVYMRNKKLEKEFEIIADPGNASEFLAHSLSDIYKPSWAK